MRWNKNGINSVLPLLIVEFDFIFIFINDDDCDWAQRNQTINMRCTWAHFQHHHRGSNRLSVWRSSLLCVPGSLVHLNYIISFRINDDAFHSFAPSLKREIAHPTYECLCAYFHLFKLKTFPSMLHISHFPLSAFAKWIVVNFLLENLWVIRHYFIINFSSYYWMDNKLKLKSNTLAA